MVFVQKIYFWTSLRRMAQTATLLSLFIRFYRNNFLFCIQSTSNILTIIFAYHEIVFIFKYYRLSFARDIWRYRNVFWLTDWLTDNLTSLVWYCKLKRINVFRLCKCKLCSLTDKLHIRGLLNRNTLTSVFCGARKMLLKPWIQYTLPQVKAKDRLSGSINAVICYVTEMRLFALTSSLMTA